MSMYSANQYDSAFKPQRLPNWCEPEHCKQRPCARGGATTFIADNRGHLLPGVKKRGTAWPDFKGTWDLPAGRSADGLRGSKSLAFDPQHSVCKNTTGLQDVGEHTSQLSCPNDGDEQSDGAALSLNAASPSTQTQREEHPHH
ncbi:protein Flattop [Pungitius pungitius]|uniref:protein Flattop n=1 Tax=Pungitius pungitius TaxID=134920 RepID=UPI002E104A5C